VKLQSIYQKAVPAPSGALSFGPGDQDVQSGNVGVVNSRLQVRVMPTKKVGSDSLILADQIEHVFCRRSRLAPDSLCWVIRKFGRALKVILRRRTSSDLHGQVYNLKPDDTTHKSERDFSNHR